MAQYEVIVNRANRGKKVGKKSYSQVAMYKQKQLFQGEKERERRVTQKKLLLVECS